jgi:fumarylacetoacetate (FAA) hydrolase family protein
MPAMEDKTMTETALPDTGLLLGRAKLPGRAEPRVVTVRDGTVVDITAKGLATVRDIAESGRAAEHVRNAAGTEIGTAEEIVANSFAARRDENAPYLLSPIDLQAVKASGVTFVVSLLERVIEEQARGDKARADALRGEILELIGTDLSELVPGSETAAKVKAALIASGRVEPVSGGGHRAGRRNLHQGPADEPRLALAPRWGCTRSRAGTIPSRKWRCW